MSPRVFVTQVPQRRGQNDVWIPVADITPAKAFGELITMLPPQAGWLSADDISVNLGRIFDEHDFQSSDYLMLMGSPLVMASAAILAAKQCARFSKPLKILVWDRDSRRYNCHEVET